MTRAPRCRTSRSAVGPSRARLLILGVLGASLGLGGCPRPATRELPRGGEPSPVARKAEATSEESRHLQTLADLESLQTIPELWNAQNQAQDNLGQALARLSQPVMHRVVRPPRPGIPHEGPQRGATVQAPRNRWTGRDDRPSLCQEACRHVAAICYAAGRICTIASRLGDWAARQACARAEERCREARQAARTRCARCPGG